MKHTLLLIFAAFATINSSAQQYILSGQITSQKNTPVSFASVYVKNTSYGTTANENGDYLFRLKPGTYHIVYRAVGYKQRTDTVKITNGDELHNVQLADEPFQLKPVKTTVNNKRDPAYYIMREVVNKRKFYLNEVNSYDCDIYIKGVKNIISVPKKLLDKSMAKLLGLDTSGRGISYQSESLSSYSFQRPHKVKEVFIASKTAGSNPPFGYNKASDLQVNFYENLFYVNGLSSHAFVSPASVFAFKYYKFKLLGAIIVDGKTIDKIQVQTRIGKALSFTGSIY